MGKPRAFIAFVLNALGLFSGLSAGAAVDSVRVDSEAVRTIFRAGRIGARAPAVARHHGRALLFGDALPAPAGQVGRCLVGHDPDITNPAHV